MSHNSVFLQPGTVVPKVPDEKADDESVVGWRNCDASCFNLRVGPNYSRNKKKAPSAPAMFECISMDIFHAETCVSPMTPLFELPEPKVKSPHPDVPSLFCASVMLPANEPKMFGGGSADEQPSFLLYVIMQMTQETANALQDLKNAEPSYRNLVRWFKEAPDDKKIAGRLKVMGLVHNWTELSLPSWLSSYNAKPVLINKSGETRRHPKGSYVEQTINIHLFNFMAKKGLYQLRPKVSKMRFAFGGTIEARDDEEMPERALFSIAGYNLPIFDDSSRLFGDSLKWLQSEAKAAGKDLD